ncbi:MAG: hypothetical protein KBF81_11850, partial [Aquabacterium sp.]|nr:hypothetical protein [Aquabacterium sp.]
VILPRLANRLVVTDVGPLIELARHDLLDLLRLLFKQVHVPQVVLDECLAHSHLSDTQRIQAALPQRSPREWG